MSAKIAAGAFILALGFATSVYALRKLAGFPLFLLGGVISSLGFVLIVY